MGVDLATYRATIGTFRHSIGVDVVTVECYVNFNGGLKTIGTVLFIGILLLIAGIESNPGPPKKQGKTKPKSSSPNKILVTGLPDIDEETLKIIIECKNYGGQRVKNVSLDQQMKTAVIEFHKSKAVNVVLSKQPVVILGRRVGMSIYNEQCKEDPGPACGAFSLGKQSADQDSDVEAIASDEVIEHVVKRHTTIVFVSGVPQNTTKEQLIKALGVQDRDGPVKEIYMNSVDMTAIVEFKKAEAVKRITKLAEVHLNERPMSICNLDAVSCADFESRMDFCRMLEMLDLKDKYPGKIKFDDVIGLDIVNSDIRTISKLTDIPWVFLQCVISSHYEARDMAVVKTDCTRKDGTGYMLSALSLNTVDKCDFSPLDIYFLTFQCCEPRLKQIMYQKLYLCKLAVPFLYNVWSKNGHVPTLAMWPLRSLTIEYRGVSEQNELKVKEADVLELSAKTVAFARYGRPRYSKSKLLNSILSNHGCKTFYNIDCPSGMTPRFVSNGNIEVFWLPNIGDKRDKFPDSVTFFNFRGDLRANFRYEVISFMSQVVDTLVIIIDSESLQTFEEDLENLVIQFPSVMFLIASSLQVQDIEFLEKFQHRVSAAKPTFKLQCMCTHRGSIEQNVVDIVTTVLQNISDLFSELQSESIEIKIEKAKRNFVESDEDSQSCKTGRKGAEHIHHFMKGEAEPNKWKQIVTPVQYSMSKKLGELLKQRAREKIFEETEDVEKDIKEIRFEMTKSVSKSLKAFADTLVASSINDLELEFFLGWLKCFIERDKRIVLPELMQKYCCAWNTLKEMKAQENKSLPEVVKQIEHINTLEKQIENSSFSIEHIFRELGHIYDAIAESGLDGKVGLPLLQKVAHAVGYCVSKGHQVELVDGESFYMPQKWLQYVFNSIKVHTSNKAVMTLSVLGLQSSGKSTLLNTMFGSQFTTRSGRCTRGVHMQLIPLKHEICNSAPFPFQYVAVIDTEGLRSSEITDLNHKFDHDNELATVITGIGDITMMNIMGENTYEIRNILQVVVHAFIRLKLANRNLDITKSCCFVHQNVPDTSASENMLSGLNKLLKLLDEMTQESAKIEGILEITTFNHVIEFDIKSQVWYLKNLWQGNQPMAMVNYEYSEHVVDIKRHILHKAKSMKSYKSIEHVFIQARDLWNGVLTEEFVFSFRNSLEIKAYTEMEDFLQSLSWKFETSVQKKMIDVVANKFASCNHKDELIAVAESTKNELMKFLAENYTQTEKEVDAFFKTNQHKDIIVQWKQTPKVRVLTLHAKLQRNIHDKVNKASSKRSIEILTTSYHAEHEEELWKKSIDVANSNKGKNLTPTQIDRLFEDIWKTFVQNVNMSSNQSNLSFKGLQTSFIQNIYDICKTDIPTATKLLQQSNQLNNIPKFDFLKGSISFSGIQYEDVGFSKNVFGLRKKSMKNVVKEVEHLLEFCDGIIYKLDHTDEEISDHDIFNLLRELQQGIANILNGHQDFVFKKTFYVKMYVHVSNFACHIFNKHNEKYQNTHGVQALLNKYKQQQKISFEAHLNNRQFEETIATLLSNVFETIVREKSQESIQISAMQFLYSKLPQVKNQVIIFILTNLAENDEFDNFIKYIRTPHKFASLWLTNRCNDLLFDKDSDDNYFTLGQHIVRDMIVRVKRCVSKFRENHTEKQSGLAVKEFIGEFNNFLKEENLVVPFEYFRTLLSQEGHIEDTMCLSDAIVNHLLTAEEKLIHEIYGFNQLTVKWCEYHPADRVIKKVWGCSEQCIFCCEPCAKNDEHADSDHYSLQHRPLCCKGTKWVANNQAVPESCNFKVQSGKEHTCNVFSYLCNQPKQEECSTKLHNYRDYKKFAPKWDIPPSSNMHALCPFWMWFVANYKEKLKTHFGYEIDNIPSNWGNVTKEQAIESLREIYSFTSK